MKVRSPSNFFFVHHEYFNEIGGGGKSGPPSLPSLPAVGGDGILDDSISFSGDGLNSQFG